jgi:NADP-dependent 3-hydroxy acid dehydrogenase YdfG
VVVTGAARGIGAATAAAFVARGARVLLTDIDGERAQEVAEQLGPAAHGCRHDVTDGASWDEVLAAAREHAGRVDVLVSNAGVMPLGAFADEPDAVSRQTIDVDLWGVVLGTRRVLPEMLERRRGHIANVASLMADLPTPGAAVYGAAKVAVRSLSDAIGYEVSGGGVTVSTILPTMVRTELSTGVAQGGGLPVVEPADVAAAIVGSCDRPRPLVYVPRSAGWVSRAAQVLPRAATDLLRRAIRHDRVLHELDVRARTAYESRLAAQRADAPRSSGAEP